MAHGAYAQTRRRYTSALEERAAHAEREREQLARIAVHEERAGTLTCQRSRPSSEGAG